MHVLAYLANNPCVDCGEDDPRVLEFDHVRGKKIAAVSVLVNKCKPIQDIDDEILKCDVRCANCHKRKTHTDLGWWKGNTSGFEPEDS